MERFQQFAVALIKFAMVAPLILPVALLIIAFVNEKFRRTLIAIFTPLAVLAIAAYLYFSPKQLNTLEDWAAVMKNDKAWLPLLVLVALLGVLAFLFGPSLRDRWLAELLRSTRREYLAALLGWAETGLAGTMELKGRAWPPEINGNLRITGQPGAGKTTLLYSQLVALARSAVNDESQPLPVWINLDELLAAPEGLERERLEILLPVRTSQMRRLLARETRLKRLIFLVDGSVEAYGTSFASLGKASTLADHGRSGPGGSAAANRLALLIETYYPCRFMLSMPAGVISGALEHLVEDELALPPLSEEEIRAAARDAARQIVLGAARAAQDRTRAETARAETARSGAAREAARINAATEAILKSDGVWRTLAARPWILNRLVHFYIKTGRLPVDLRELFRSMVYPGPGDAADFETSLTGLAHEVARTGLYWQPLRALAGSSRADLEALGVIRVQHARPQAGRPQPRLAFAHPIILAYFTAVDWQNQHSFKTLAGQMAKLQSDPILADAVVFFNNMVSDPALLTDILSALVVPENEGENSGSMGLFLAAQCLLTMPAAKRPPELAEKVAIQLMEQAGDDPTAHMVPDAVNQAWRLLEPLDAAGRLAVYASAIQGMDDKALEHTLRRIAGHAPADLHGLLWIADEATSRKVGLVWANASPRESAALFQELYEKGPAERRRLALECLGELPEEAVAEYLTNLFQTESDAGLRVDILRSLHSSGADLPFTLLEIVSKRSETDEVRIYAAELLATSESPELRSQSVLREIIRTSRMTMPERARINLQRLLEKLRSELPQDINRWEDIVNPYVVGRPLAQRDPFFGREDLLLELRSAVENCTPVLLTGERRIGKTSLLLRLAALLEEEARQTVPVRSVYLDLQGLQPHEFYETAIRAIIEGLRDENLAADSEVARPYTDAHFSRDLGEVLTYQQERLGPNSRLALLLDEADTLAEFPAAFHAALRRVFSAAADQGFSVILASVDPQGAWTNTEPPCWDSFARLTVPRLAHGETLELITSPVEGVFRYAPEVQEAIWRAAQGHPAETQALCQRLAGLMLAHGERTATISMVQEALQVKDSPRAELVHQAESLLGGMIDWMDAHPTASSAQVEEQMKRAWGELQKIFLQQVIKARKRNGGTGSGGTGSAGSGEG